MPLDDMDTDSFEVGKDPPAFFRPVSSADLLITRAIV
jgi:hypothetical protein